MIKFQTNVCPLCDKVLKFHQVAKVNVYTCSNHAAGERSHYEVEYDKAAIIQHIYVGDWGIDNYDNSFRSRVYKRLFTGGTEKWVLVAETNRIFADIESRMLERLTRLVP